MIIDIIFFILLAIACYKGFTKGLIGTVFSFIAIIIGIVAALKFSSTVATWLQKSTSISQYWLPFLSFTIIMLAVILIAKVGAKLVEKTVQFALMGWLNKCLGILLYIAIYFSLFSVVLFFFEKMNLIKPLTIESSKTHFLIQPWAEIIINSFGKILPMVKEVLQQLEIFFNKTVSP